MEKTGLYVVMIGTSYVKQYDENYANAMIVPKAKDAYQFPEFTFAKYIADLFGGSVYRVEFLWMSKAEQEMQEMKDQEKEDSEEIEING